MNNLLAILNQTGLQSKDPALYQFLKSLIDSINSNPVDIPTQIHVMEVDTRTVAPTIYLNNIGDVKTIIKDVYGNAAANNITISGTVDGVVNPVINTNFGVYHVYASKTGLHTWT